MKTYIGVLTMALVSGLLFSACSNKLHFLVCPSEFTSKMKAENDFGQQREILFGSSYRIVVVEKISTGEIKPVQHYVYRSDDVSKVIPEAVSFEKPFAVSTIIIVDNDKRQLGIAIKKKTDKFWKIYWAEENEIKPLATINDVGILFLPPYESLPIIKTK